MNSSKLCTSSLNGNKNGTGGNGNNGSVIGGNRNSLIGCGANCSNWM